MATVKGKMNKEVITKKVLSMIFVLLIMTFSFVSKISIQGAADAEKTRAIAIVFDNSGSMYIKMNGDDDSTKAWCRATYAMESFATMMNSSDVMMIYPMHSITVDGKTYSSNNPLKVTQKNAAIIREIYTPNPKGTPIETISVACEGLQATSADEKWLIVLTDGDKFYQNGSEMSKENTITQLNSVLSTCNSTVNVMYLGIGANAAMPTSVKGNYDYYAEKAQSSAEVLSKLTNMCNTIFGRDTLTVTGKEISFDVSMSKLILFIQGSGIQNVSLSGVNPIWTSELKFASKGGGGQATGIFQSDNSLQGVMLTYNDLDAGTYNISYGGNATSVVAYYEPNVDIAAVLYDATGNRVATMDSINAGTYTMKYMLVDRSGVPTSSKLLGNTKYEVTYSINGNEHLVVSDKAGEIELEMQPNDVLDAYFKVTYLNGYTLQRGANTLGWPQEGLVFNPPPAGMLKASLSSGAKSYRLTKLPEESVYRVNFEYEGANLSGTQLDNVVVTAKLEGGKASCTVNCDDQGYYVTIGYNETALNTDIGDYTLSVTGIYTNEDGLDTNLALAKANFKIVDDSSKLAMSVDVEQDYYVTSQLKDGKPIIVNLTLGGQLLTKEQMKQVQFSATADGVKLIATPLPDKSAYEIKIDADNPPKDGKYGLKFSATTVNNIGREVKAENSTTVEVNALPLWLRILIPILIILLIAALVLVFMTRKVLPKNIRLINTSFIVDGEKIKGNANPNYSGAGKKTGSITISSPRYQPNPMAKASLSMTIEAVSPRYVRSSQRRMRVVQISPAPKTYVNSYALGNASFTKDATTGKFKKGGGKTQDFQPFEFGNNAKMSIRAEVLDGDGGTVAVSFSSNIQFL